MLDDLETRRTRYSAAARRTAQCLVSTRPRRRARRGGRSPAAAGAVGGRDARADRPRPRRGKKTVLQQRTRSLISGGSATPSRRGPSASPRVASSAQRRGASPRNWPPRLSAAPEPSLRIPPRPRRGTVREARGARWSKISGMDYSRGEAEARLRRGVHAVPATRVLVCQHTLGRGARAFWPQRSHTYTGFAALRKWTPQPSPSKPSSPPSASAARSARSRTKGPRGRVPRSARRGQALQRVSTRGQDRPRAVQARPRGGAIGDRRARPRGSSKVAQLEAQLRDAQTSATEEERTTYELGWRSSKPRKNGRRIR